MTAHGDSLASASRPATQALSLPTDAPPVARSERRAARINKLLTVACAVFAASVPLDAIPIAGSLGVARVFGIALAAAALTQPGLAFRRPPAAFWWFAVYTLIALVSSVPHLDFYGDAVQRRMGSLVQTLLLFWIVSNLMRDEQLAGRMLASTALMGGLIALLMGLGVFQSSVHTARGVRMSFASTNPNFIGGVLTLSLLSLVGLTLAGRFRGRLWRWTTIALTLPMAGAIISTGSRGSLAGLFGGMAVLVLLGERLTRRLRNLLLLSVAGLVAYYTVYVTSISQVRWGEAIEQRSVSGREQIFPELVAMFRERPLQGWGFEAHRRELGRRVPQLTTGALDAHNLYLHVLTEVGLLGSIPFWVALWLCVKSGIAALRTPHRALPLVLLSAMLITNLATTGIVSKPLWFVLACAAGAGAGVPRRRRRPAVVNVDAIVPARSAPESAG